MAKIETWTMDKVRSYFTEEQIRFVKQSPTAVAENKTVYPIVQFMTRKRAEWETTWEGGRFVEISGENNYAVVIGGRVV